MTKASAIQFLKVFPRFTRMSLAQMKRFTREKVIGIISKLGGEDEKNKTMDTLSQSQKNQFW
jgi:hypothetical protein